MVYDFDFASVTNTPVFDRIQRGERINDDLPRRRYQLRDKPEGKKHDEAPPEEDAIVVEDDGTNHQLDLMV